MKWILFGLAIVDEYSQMCISGEFSAWIGVAFFGLHSQTFYNRKARASIRGMVSKCHVRLEFLLPAQMLSWSHKMEFANKQKLAKLSPVKRNTYSSQQIVIYLSKLIIHLLLANEGNLDSLKKSYTDNGCFRCKFLWIVTILNIWRMYKGLKLS